MLRIGVDIGGTFTDFAIWRSEAGGYTKVEAMKVPSTPPNFAVGMQQGLLALIEAGRIDPDEPMLIVHGTTVSTNAVIERSGAPLALLVTAGFRDILAVARLRVDRPVNLFANRAPPLIPRRMVHEIDERLLADGTVDRSLPEAAVQPAPHPARHGPGPISRGLATGGRIRAGQCRSPQRLCTARDGGVPRRARPLPG
jgi:N-methylhydantoinase A